MNVVTAPTRPHTGRRRNDAARQAILAGALALLSGGQPLSIERLAVTAGVGKQTIYRWWPTKAAVVLEALAEGARRAAPQRDTGSLETDVRRLMRDTVAATAASINILSALMAEAQLDDRFGREFREGFLAGRRSVLRDVIERGRARGQLADDADPDLLVELAFGLLWYRILTRHAPLNRRFADQITDAVLTVAMPRDREDAGGSPELTAGVEA